MRAMRIAIVNDLALAREVLRRLVLSVPGYSVAWTAADGAEAVRKASADRPDVILMDLVMPVMDGVEATRRIMAASPCPVLIADVEGLIRAMEPFIQGGTLRRCDRGPGAAAPRKRVLVVDDSITVREVQRQILRTHGYDVEVAVDGQDGWNKLRAGGFDLVISDVDMPRLTGLEFVRRIRDDYGLRDLPVIIVSYKDRDEDRLRGLEAGANHYLTKGSFHDHTFLDAVAGLIGRP